MGRKGTSLFGLSLGHSMDSFGLRLGVHAPKPGTWHVPFGGYEHWQMTHRIPFRLVKTDWAAPEPEAPGSGLIGNLENLGELVTIEQAQDEYQTVLIGNPSDFG